MVVDLNRLKSVDGAVSAYEQVRNYAYSVHDINNLGGGFQSSLGNYSVVL